MLANFEAYLGELLEAAIKKTGIPGISVAVSAGGRRFAVAKGVADVTTGAALTGEHRFQIGCLSKLLTGLIVSRLVGRELLDLEATVDACLPAPDSALLHKVRVRHLLCHSGGYEGHNLAHPEVGYYYTPEKFASFLAETPRTFAPGTVFNYDHSQFVILGELVRHLVGRTVPQLLREWVFEPLGLIPGCTTQDQRAPRFQVADHVPGTRTYQKIRTIPYCRFWESSLADLSLSPTDLVTLGELLAGVTALPDWSPTALARLREPLMTLPEPVGGITSEQIPMTYGFGCARYPDGAFGHNGSVRGQTIGFRFEPKSRVALAVAMNSWQPHLREVLVHTLCKAVLTARDEEVAAVRPVPSSELEGQYHGGVQGMRLEVSRHEDGFQCLAHNRGAPAALRILLRPDASGNLTTRAEVPPPALAFFNEPEAGRPCMMLGLNAFRAAA